MSRFFSITIMIQRDQDVKSADGLDPGPSSPPWAVFSMFKAFQVCQLFHPGAGGELWTARFVRRLWPPQVPCKMSSSLGRSMLTKIARRNRKTLRRIEELVRSPAVIDIVEARLE